MSAAHYAAASSSREALVVAATLQVHIALFLLLAPVADSVDSATDCAATAASTDDADDADDDDDVTAVDSSADVICAVDSAADVVTGIGLGSTSCWCH